MSYLSYYDIKKVALSVHHDKMCRSHVERVEIAGCVIRFIKRHAEPFFVMCEVSSLFMVSSLSHIGVVRSNRLNYSESFFAYGYVVL